MALVETYKKLSRKKREEIERDIINYFKEIDFVDSVILFGSFVSRNYFRDIDIALILNRKITDRVMDRMANELELKLKLPIDIRIFNDLPLKLQFYALKYGKEVLIKNRESFFRIKREVISRFLDFRHVSDRYTRELLKWKL